MRNTVKVLVTLVLLTGSAALLCLQAGELFVALDGSDPRDYTSWETAGTNIAEAVALAQTDDTIWIKGGTYNLEETITLPRRMSLIGTNGTVTLDGGGKVRCLEMTASAGYLANLTFANGYTEENGGGVRVMNGVFTNCVFTGNVATNGGGVYVQVSNANVQFFDCIFTNNRAIATGGGARVQMYTHKYLFERCSFFGNKSGGAGGGAYFDYSLNGTNTALVSKCDFFENEAGTSGGGIYAYGVRVEDCNIYSNKAINVGGGVNLVDVSTTGRHGVMNGCRITYNEANTAGGITMTGALLKDCYIGWNVATNGSRSYGTGGGGVTMASGVVMEHCTVEFNSVPNGGGGGIITSYGSIVRNCLIRSNNAYYVGGLYVSRSGLIENCTVSENVASNGYGGLYMRGGDNGSNYRNNIIYGNRGAAATATITQLWPISGHSKTTAPCQHCLKHTMPKPSTMCLRTRFLWILKMVISGFREVLPVLTPAPIWPGTPMPWIWIKSHALIW